MRKSRLITSRQDMEKLRERWIALHVSGRHTVFQSFRWNQLAAQAFADNETALIALSESDSGTAIIPASIDIPAKRLSLIGETLFDYRDALTVGDLAPLHRAWSELAAIATKHGCSFDFASLRPDAQTASKWSGFQRTPYTSAPYLLRGDKSVA